MASSARQGLIAMRYKADELMHRSMLSHYVTCLVVAIAVHQRSSMAYQEYALYVALAGGTSL